MREDRYGRLTATLILNGRAIAPGMVLGTLQLSLEQHRQDLATAKAGGPLARAL